MIDLNSRYVKIKKYIYIHIEREVMYLNQVSKQIHKARTFYVRMYINTP